jgi:hypothetical protein
MAKKLSAKQKQRRDSLIELYIQILDERRHEAVANDMPMTIRNQGKILGNSFREFIEEVVRKDL